MKAFSSGKHEYQPMTKNLEAGKFCNIDGVSVEYDTANVYKTITDCTV